MRYANLESQKLKGKNQKLLIKERGVGNRSRSRQENASQSRLGEFFRGLVLPLKFALSHWKIFGASLLIFGTFLVGWYGYSALRSLNVKAQDLVGVPQAAVNFVTQKGPQVLSTDGRSNVLLLGIGGEGHDGPYLTDSILVASVDVESGDTVLISLPRDVWSPVARAKINAVYAFARQKELSDGLPTVKKAVGEILGLDLHYAVRIDFKGFVRAIDLLDGIEVDVQRAFVDSKYPVQGRERDMCGLVETEVVVEGDLTEAQSDSSEISEGDVGNEVVNSSGVANTEIRLIDAQGNDRTDDPLAFNCRYEIIRYEPGLQVMSGLQALKFVRSRHGTNNEGSDFARADRQQRVIAAFKDEVLSAGTLLNPARMTNLIEEFGRSIDTDIKVTDYGEFVKLAQLTQDKEVRSHTISAEGEDALLVVPPSREPYGGAYVLVPKGGDWELIHETVKKWLSGEGLINETPAASPAKQEI